jgi:uncharacterized protein (TIGR02996 family)
MTSGQLAQRDVFLSEIRDDPDDDLPRLVLGDWLADQGDPRGEFIQLDVHLATLPEGAERREMEERRRRLLAAHATGWLGPLLDFASEFRWERGMLHIRARGERIRNGRAVLGDAAFDWVEGLRLEGHLLSRQAWMALLLRITSLDIPSSGLCDHSLPRLLRYYPALSALRWLNLSDNRIGPEGTKYLASGCRSFAGLTRLDLSGNPINDEAAKALVDSPHLNRLRRLDLSGNDLSHAMIASLNERFGPGVVRLS